MAAKTKLDEHRKHLGITVDDLARVTGISRTTLGRLLRGELDNPPLRYLVNCQIALGLDSLLDVIDDDQLKWFVFDKRFAAKPPDAKKLWSSK